MWRRRLSRMRRQRLHVRAPPYAGRGAVPPMPGRRRVAECPASALAAERFQPRTKTPTGTVQDPIRLASKPTTRSGPEGTQGRPELASTGQPGQHGDMVQRVVGTVGANAHPPRVATPASVVHRGLAITLVVLVLLQAMIAGQFLFGGWAIDLHGWIGNGSFALGVVLVVLAVRSGVGNGGAPVAVALVVAMFVQTGLGYAGRTALGAASWHVPLGVAIFGLAVVHATLLAAPITGATPSAPPTAASAKGSP